MSTAEIRLLLIAILAFFTFSAQSVDPRMVKKAAKIHDKVLTVDSHVDTPLRMLRGDFDLGQYHEPNQRSGKLDLPRMRQGGLDAVFFAVFVGQGERNEAGHARAQATALNTFEAIHGSLKQHRDLAELALSPKDAYRLEKLGKRAIFIGMENGYPIGNDLSLIKKYYDLGARYITLCHTKNNDICDSSTDTTEHHGLSHFGEQVVAEMNRVGMMIDISHVSDKTFYDVIALSKAPVIASHSCARALCDHPRNLSDAMLKKLAENGGVIQMCIMSDYVKKPEPNPERDAAFQLLEQKYKNFDQLAEDEQRKARQEWYELNEKYPRKLATVSDVVDHIDHIVKVAGIDHVGIGTDFDGGGGVEGCNDVSQMGNITLELVKRGYSEQQIRKIWGGNLMRVMTEVERIAKKIQQEK